MRLHVSDIRSEGRLEFAEDLDPQPLLGVFPEFIDFKDPLRTKVVVQMSETDIHINGAVTTNVTFICARCLERFTREFTGRFQQTVADTAEIIDLSPDIKETLLIDLPLKALCREDCQGICPACGKNKNKLKCQCDAATTNTRWNAFKNIDFK